MGEKMYKAIVNAGIITPLEEIPCGTVLIKDGRIERIIRGRQKSSLSPFLDAKGKILCPGFIDLHLQGGGGADVIEGSPQAINSVSYTHAKYGTTSFLATTITTCKNGEFLHIAPILRMIEEGTEGAQILGIHLEGPFINPRRKGMIKKDYVRKPDLAELRKIIKTCRGKLRMLTIAPELKGSLQLIKELQRHGIIASIGHTDATYEEAMAGIRAGITHATHFFNAMSGLHHRLPGAAGACLDSELSVQIIADFVHIHPAVIRLVLKLKGVERVALITDAVMAADMPDGIYEAGGQRVRVKEGVCRGRGGILAGSTLTLNRAVRSIVSLGFSLADAIRMATLTPAKILGIENKKGIIKEGSDADLILIDKELNVYFTMVKGRIVWKHPQMRI